MPLSQPQFDKAFALLLPFMDDSASRKTFIVAALYDQDLSHINWDGAARTFTEHLIYQLDRFGQNDTYLLKALFLRYREIVGLETQMAIDAFMQELVIFLASEDPKTYVSKQKHVDSSLKATTSQPVFISYSRVDTEFAHNLYSQLKGLGFKLWRDRTDMEIGEDWWQQIEEAIESSVTMVLCLSPAALASPVVKEEWLHARRKGIRVMPIIAADVDFQTAPRWMTRTDWADFRPGAREADLVWGRFIHQLNSHYEPVKTPFIVDELPSYHVPRTTELNQIVQELVDDVHGAKVAQIALHGTGGFGKTMLASAVCHDQRVRDAFDDGIVCVKLGQIGPKPEGRLVKILNDLVKKLTPTVPNAKTLDAAKANLVEALGKRYMLIVIDDVWDKKHLTPFLQGGPNCSRLITTRNLNTLERSIIKVPIRAMSQTDALNLISKDLNDASTQQAQLQELSNRLGCWPLIIKVANALLFDRLEQLPLSQALHFFTGALTNRGFDYLVDPDDQDQQDSAISAVLHTSLEQLATHPGWRELYNKMAVLPSNEDISENLLSKLWNLDIYVTPDLCQRLYNLSLIERYTNGSIRLNDVIVEWLRQQNRSQLPAWREAFLINAAEFVHESINSDTLLDGGWQPIYQAMVEVKKGLGWDRNPALSQAINNIMLDYWEHSRFLEWRAYLQEAENALLLAIKAVEENSRDWIIHQKNLAIVYEMQGKFSSAIKLLETLIPISQGISDWRLESKLVNNLANNVFQPPTLAGCERAIKLYDEAFRIVNQNLPDANIASLSDLRWKGTVLGGRGMILGGLAYFADEELKKSDITSERRAELEEKISTWRSEAITVCSETQDLVDSLLGNFAEDELEQRKVEKLQDDNQHNLAQILSQTNKPDDISKAKSTLQKVLANARQRGDRHREAVALVGILEPLKKQNDQAALKEAYNYVFGTQNDLAFEGYTEDAGEGAIKVNTATGSIPELRNLLRDFLPHFSERLFAENFKEHACRMLQAAFEIVNKSEFDHDDGIEALHQDIKDLRASMNC